MNGTAPAGVAVITGCVVLLLMVARYWPAPSGAHRRPPTDQTQPHETGEPADCETTTRIAYVIVPPVTWPAPAPAAGAVVAQAIRDCPACHTAQAGVIVRGGWRCGTCHTTTEGDQ